MTVSSLLHYRARDVSVSAKVANAFRRRRFKLRDECGCTSSIKIRSSARCEKEGAPTGEERRGGGERSEKFDRSRNRNWITRSCRGIRRRLLRARTRIRFIENFNYINCTDSFKKRRGEKKGCNVPAKQALSDAVGRARRENIFLRMFQRRHLKKERKKKKNKENYRNRFHPG